MSAVAYCYFLEFIMARVIRHGIIYLLLGLWTAACGSATASSASVDGKLHRPARSCEDGEVSACFDLGVRYEQGKDERRAEPLFTMACDRGHAESCSHLGALYEQGRGVEKDEALAVGYFTMACDGRHAAGCFRLGQLFAQGRGVDKDEARAASLVTQACDLGDAAGCFQVAASLEQSGDVANTGARTVALVRKACDGGHGAACFNLASRFEDGHGVQRNATRAADLFQRACDGGHAAGCVSVGLLYEHGRVVEKDEARAAALYTKACQGGDAAGCFHLGVMFHEGRGVDGNEVRAAEFLAKACAGGYAPAYSICAYRFAQGHGVATDEAHAAEFYEKACNGDEAASCFELGVLLESGRGVSKDEPRALALYQKACDGNDARGCTGVDMLGCARGDAPSCSQLAMRFDEGRGVDQDRARAVELYSQACKSGDAMACTPQKLRTHYATILKGLATRNHAPCSERPPSGTIRATLNVVRLYADAPPLPPSDLNVALEPQNVISSHFDRLANRTGASWLQQAKEILSAQATLVVEVEAEVPAVVVDTTQTSPLWSTGRFKSGTLTVRQVRFDAAGKAVCATRVTVKNTTLRVKQGETVVTAARQQLRDSIAGSF